MHLDISVETDIYVSIFEIYLERVPWEIPGGQVFAATP